MRLAKLQRSLADADGFAAQAEQERRLASIVGALCGNPAIALYMHLFNWLTGKAENLIGGAVEAATPTPAANN